MNSEWMTLSKLAEDFDKSKMTMFRWANEGFLLTLGYRIWRDAKGKWYVTSDDHEKMTPPKP